MRAELLHDAMAGHVGAGTVPGLVTLLARGDEVVVDAIGVTASGGTAPMRADTLFRIMSMTKPVTAAAVLLLVQDGLLVLDDPVDALLPELADRRVLRRPDGPLTDTVASVRPITARDLLTFTWGFGLDLDLPPTAPIRRAALDLAVGGPPLPPPYVPDEWMRRLGALPLQSQPGEKWIYDTGSAVLGVLVARASGTSLEEFLRSRLFAPLGMVDTGFSVPAAQLHRLPPLRDGAGVLDPVDGAWSRPPAFPSGNGGLVSTAADYLAFARMIVDGGGGLLTPASTELMLTDHVTPAQRGSMILGDRGWGLGLSLHVDGTDEIGWTGGGGTTWFSDPARGTTALLFTQRVMAEWAAPVLRDFTDGARAALLEP